MSNNLKIFNQRLETYARQIENRIEAVLIRVAEEIVSDISSGGAGIPVDTSNLKDSTGVGVYKNGSLIKFMPPKQAIQMRDKKWGSDELSEALELASTKFSTGVWICLMTTMPYAEKVDLYSGYFSDRLSSKLPYNVKMRVYEIKRA